MSIDTSLSEDVKNLTSMSQLIIYWTDIYKLVSCNFFIVQCCDNVVAPNYSVTLAVAISTFGIQNFKSLFLCHRNFQPATRYLYDMWYKAHTILSQVTFFSNYRGLLNHLEYWQATFPVSHPCKYWFQLSAGNINLNFLSLLLFNIHYAVMFNFIPN